MNSQEKKVILDKRTLDEKRTGIWVFSFTFIITYILFYFVDCSEHDTLAVVIGFLSGNAIYYTFIILKRFFLSKFVYSFDSIDADFEAKKQNKRYGLIPLFILLSVILTIILFPFSYIFYIITLFMQYKKEPEKCKLYTILVPFIFFILSLIIMTILEII